MVNPILIEAIRNALGDTPRKIFVTGGSGFVGSHLARALAEAGHEVVSTGRNRYKTSLTFHPGVQFIEADLQDRAAMLRLTQGCDLVYHVAALASPWASAARSQVANVQGTRHVVEGCAVGGVRRLVHVSSTSIFFEYKDRPNLRDDAPLPARFACTYAASKAAAELVVREAQAKGLDAVIVRARAVFGAGDNHLLPRVLETAKRGRLGIIGHGENLVDLTYIDNLICALALAGVRGNSGLAVTITNDEPVRLWAVLRQLVEASGMKLSRRRMPYPMAIGLAGLSEAVHRLLPQRGEPALTRYAVGLLAKTQTFDQTLAKQSLGYKPFVTMEQGLALTNVALRKRDDQPAKAAVRYRLFSTGYTPQAERWIVPGGGRQTIRVHASFALIEHPAHGALLFDTGYAPRFHQASARFPYALYARITPVQTREEWTAAAWLKKIGIEPQSIRRIILSHFHADHIGGLRDFPETEVITSAEGWSDVRNRRGWGALRRGILPDLLPENFLRQLRAVDSFHDPGIGPFEHSHDLFGDGSIRLISLSGHAIGQIGVLLQTDVRLNKRAFLVADATWSGRSIPNADLPPFPMLWLLGSAREFERTLQKLSDFQRQYPEIALIPTHCPDVAKQWDFDRMLETGMGADES